MKSLYTIFTVLLFTVCITNNNFAQCSTCTYTVNANSNSNYNLNSGQTLCIKSGVVFTGNININGGTVCNNGTITNSNVNFNSGTIYNYGTWTKNSALPLGGKFHNYGTLTIGNSININNNGELYNYLGATLTVGGHLNNNYIFKNYGDVKIDGNFSANHASVNESYGNMSVSDGNADINSAFLNEGSLYIKGYIHVNSNGSFTNGTNDRVKIDGHYENNSTSINHGSIEVGGNFTNNGGAIFTDNLSITVLGNFMNNGTINGDAVGCNIFSVFGNSVVLNGGASLSSIDFCGNSVPGNFTTNYGTIASNVTFCTCSSGGVSPLPIVLTSFTAVCNAGNVQVDWTTATEINNAFFTILRSEDAVNWEPIHVMAGAGSSNTELHYSYVDNRSLQTTSYYRLQQTDFDGTNEIFDPASVTCNGNLNNVSVFPNPADEQFTVSIQANAAGKSSIELVDFTGRSVLATSTNLIKGANSFSFDRNGLSSGTYFLCITLNGEVLEIQKLVLR